MITRDPLRISSLPNDSNQMARDSSDSATPWTVPRLCSGGNSLVLWCTHHPACDTRVAIHILSKHEANAMTSRVRSTSHRRHRRIRRKLAGTGGCSWREPAAPPAPQPGCSSLRPDHRTQSTAAQQSTSISSPRCTGGKDCATGLQSGPRIRPSPIGANYCSGLLVISGTSAMQRPHGMYSSSLDTMAVGMGGTYPLFTWW